VKDDARTYELLRERDRAKRAIQVWAAGTIIWAVVLGWAIWGFLNGITGGNKSLVIWLVVYLVPVAVLAFMTLVQFRRRRGIETRLEQTAEDAERKKRNTN
jgi:small-conductance mechanosensitive channel